MDLDPALIEKLKTGEPLTAAERRRAEKLIAQIETAQLQAKRLDRITRAKVDLLEFTKLTMPDFAKADDPLATRYSAARHHRAIAAALQKVEAGEWLNLILVMPPRHGKTELATRRMPVWFVGRDPTRSVAVGTYSDDLAGDLGRDVRGIMDMSIVQQMFPGITLRKGSRSADRMETEAGGKLYFVGRGTGITGRGADLIIIDDPLKNREEADSKATRDKVWKWWQDDIQTRLLDEGGRFVIIQTRWHEDDLIGRLTDPNNPHFVEEEARKWRILELPALAGDDDPIGRAKGEALWPERFGAAHLESIRTRNPRGFASLYQGRPAPEDGDEFKADWMKPYRASEYPKHGRVYAASDHAVATGQENDRTCFGIGATDEDGILYISPDLEWGRFATDLTVDKMLGMMVRTQPLFWWAENEHISKAFGPFLRRRMHDERVWCVIEPVTVRKDKRVIAQTARGMLASGMVRFPTFAPWWADAKDELLKFPNGTHDDFVSFLSLLCMGVDRMVKAKRKLKLAPQGPATGTIGWIIQQSKQRQGLLLPTHEGF
jgi:hypothetical protein